MPIPGNFVSPTTEAVDPNTSGWTAKLNCTTALGSGGRNGPGCLRLTSVAAGEMQARTVSSYPVTPGETYLVFADASAATQPERIGIRWLHAAGAEISIAWSMVTAQASASWHRVSVAWPAPAEAARAQVVVSSTPAAGGVFHYWENVYLGLPKRTLGNLFSFGVESTEVDTSGWAPEVNATVTRTVPVMTWPVDWYYAGGHVVTMTATAAGNAAVQCTERAPVTPGVDYLAYAYLVPPTISANAWIELRFLDSNGNQVSAARSALAAATGGFQRQRVSDVAPPNAATCAVALGLDGASGGQILRAETIVATIAPQGRNGNALAYAQSSFEQNTGGWTVASGPAALARSTPWGLGAEGSYALAITSATAAASLVRSPMLPVPGASGLPWRSEGYVQVTAGAWNVRRHIRWFDGLGTLLGTDSGDAAPAPDDGWWLLGSSWEAPEGTASAQVEYALTSTAPISALLLDRVSLWQAKPTSEVTAYDDAAYITVTLRDVPVGVWSLWRIGSDGSRTLVRGPAGLVDGQPLDADTVTIEDYEAPLGVWLSYVAEVRDPATGALLARRTTNSVRLDPGDGEACWIKDPSNPRRNTRFLMAQVPVWSRPIVQADYRVIGRRNSVTHSGKRGGLEGDLLVYTRSDNEAAALHRLLDDGTTLLWQVTPGLHEADMYLTVGQVPLPRVAPHTGEAWRVWTLPVRQEDMPIAAGVNGSAGRTWRDILLENATGRDVLARYATAEDMLLNRQAGG